MDGSATTLLVYYKDIYSVHKQKRSEKGMCVGNMRDSIV